MPQALSTSLSDLVLALSAFHASYTILPTSAPATIGFLIIAMAASLGTIRFASPAPSEDLLSLHKYFSWLSTVVGMCLLASAYHRQQNSILLANAHIACGLAAAFLRPYLSEVTIDKVTEGVSTVAVLSIIVLNVLQFNIVGLIGALMYAVSGLVIGAEGHWIGIPRVDIFHYALVIGNIALMIGLQSEPSPIYYRPKA